MSVRRQPRGRRSTLDDTGCSPRRVWSVTVAVVLVAKLLGLRKSVCANFVIADSRLTLDQQDLFTASQIIHASPRAQASTMSFDIVREKPSVPTRLVQRGLSSVTARGLHALGGRRRSHSVARS